MERTPQELLEVSKHVLYEVDMLQVTASAIATEITRGSLLHNALTESFLVHARNLIHFLFPEGPHQTDVLAVHFLDEPDRWESLRGGLPDALKSVRGRASKQVAHITYDRLEAVGEAKRWAYLEILNAIMPRVEVFRLNAKPELLDERWVEIAPPS